MKALVIGTLIVASTVALARKEDRWVRYQCMAKGTINGQTKKAQGWERNTIPEAKASAIKVCGQRGYTGCAVTACYERWW